jgi:cytoskeletal protein CcmA (bactofilin family)
MFGSATKIPTTCPHCGFVQLEPRELISTYCRGCGDHFHVRSIAALPPAPRPALAERLRKKLTVPRQRSVACHQCGNSQDVPAHAQSAGCRTCGATIDLTDIEILGHSTRVIQTRGTVHVGRDGFLNSTRIDCANAFIEGRVAGKITCEGTLRLRGEGICRAQIRTQRLLVDRGSNLHFPYTIRAEEVLLRGRVAADVYCSGRLHIGRHGGLEGDLQARAMLVDKGGFYGGNVEISTAIPNLAPVPPEQPEMRVHPAWLPRPAFG